MYNLTADLSTLSSHEIQILLPSLYFYHENMETKLVDLQLDPCNLYPICSTLSLLDCIMETNTIDIWIGVKATYSRKSDSCDKNISLLHYENQSVDVKIQLVMQMLLHLMERLPTSECFSQNCCQLLNTESLQDELVAIIYALIQTIPAFECFPRLLCGYIKHTNRLDYNLLRRLLYNFPDQRFHCWSSLFEASEQLPRCSVKPIASETHTSREGGIKSCNSSLKSQLGVVDFGHHYLKPDILRHRIECLLRCLTATNSTYLTMTIERCISLHCFPTLIMDSIFLLDDIEPHSVVLYLKRLLLEDGPETRVWFSAYLKQQTHPSGILERLNEYFVESVTQLLPKNPDTPLTDNVLLQALALLRVLASLRGFANFTFTPALSSHLLTLLTHKTNLSERGSEYTTYTLAFLIGLRSSLSSSQDSTGRAPDVDNRIIAWLQRLLDDEHHPPNSEAFPIELDSSIDSSPLSRSYIEPLLLLAILFHTNQPGPITDLISNILGLRIPSLGRTVNSWRKIFLQSVFTENMIATQAAQVPVTRALNRRLSSHLPIQCILQLLKSHAFSKNRLEIKVWILGQIDESVRPLHPLLPDLVEAHIIHSFGSVNSGGRQSSVDSNGALISELELRRQFGADGRFLGYVQLCAPVASNTQTSLATKCTSHSLDLTPLLLYLYYALYVYDHQLNVRLTTNQHCPSNESASIHCYSNQLWEQIPITYLLRHARAHLSDYAPLYPRLLQLVTNHFPNLTIGEMMIQDELLLDPCMWSSEGCNEVDQSGVVSSSTESTRDQTMEPTAFVKSTAEKSHSSLSQICTPSELDQAFDRVLRCAPNAATQCTPSRADCRQLISLVHQLHHKTMRTGRIDDLIPYGCVVGHQIPQLLLHHTGQQQQQQQKHDALFSVNRRFICLLEHLWCRLHLIMPRRLQVVTVNALRNSTMLDSFPVSMKRNCAKLTSTDLWTDPVENILNRVDRAVFRSPPALRIFLRILEANLLASRSYWGHRLVERVIPSLLVPTSTSAIGSGPTITPPGMPCLTRGPDANREAAVANAFPTAMGNVANPSGAGGGGAATTAVANLTVALTDEEYERFCANLLLTQNATVVQLLLEHCLPSKEELTTYSEISVLREIRNIICTYLHYMFIAEPALAEVIVWQTYPNSLIPISVQAIPSLHICLDHVVHVFRLSGDYAKMVFALDLVSHLSLHYNIQSALERAAFMIDSLYHLLTAVICVDDRPDLLQACLPPLLRIGGAFPSLAPVIARLLLTVGAMIADTIPEESRSGLNLLVYTERDQLPEKWTEETYDLSLACRSVRCLEHTMWTFNKLIRRCSAQRHLYYTPELHQT